MKITKHNDYTVSLRLDRDEARVIRGALWEASSADHNRANHLPGWWPQTFATREEAAAWFRKVADEADVMARTISDGADL